jgi:hypothetical protein
MRPSAFARATDPCAGDGRAAWIAILRRTIADAALLQASQQQITAAANIGLAARQRALASTGQANEIYRFAERFSQ